MPLRILAAVVLILLLFVGAMAVIAGLRLLWPVLRAILGFLLILFGLYVIWHVIVALL